MSAYNYGKYAQDDNQNNSGSDDSGSSGSGSSDPDKNLTMTPKAAIEGDLVKVFGNENQWGQSLGLSWENVELVDGCLYFDPEKDKHKIFSWMDVVGMSPDEGDVSADDANQYLVKNYGSTEKRYELVEAVIPGEDDPVSIGNAVMWYSGSEEHGPKSASKTLAKILTRYGREATEDEDDINNWLVDVSGDNVLRSDLEGRRFAFFEVKKQSNQSEFKYQHPVVIDTQTEAEVTVQNGNSDASQGTLDGSEDTPEAVADGGPEADEADEAGDVPEPIEDFISTCDSLGFTDEDRAATLLTDLVEDEGNDLTADMVADFGGEEAVLGRVTQ